VVRTPLPAFAGRWARLLGLLLVAGLTALTACSSGGTVIVTVTTTPGAGSPVTAPTLSAGSSAGSGTGDSSPTGQPSSASTGSPSPSTATVRVSASPAFGSKNIGPGDPVTVTVFSAELQNMTMTGDDGSTIEGTIAKDKHTWTKAERLKYNVTYTIAGTAKAADGSEHKISGKLTTVNPKSTVRASFQRPIANADTVGIATPIIITFSGPIQDKAAAEKAFKVTTDKGEIKGSWGWLQDEDFQGSGVKQSSVHFRPAQYWPGNTKVHVEADLYGVNYGNGWGREDITADFTIGRALVVKADVNSHRLVVVVDDKIVKNYPVSYGKESVPGRNTVSGIHVVTEKYPTFKMCNPQYDYCNVEEHWAVRINNNGEFIHANPQVTAYLGKANVSHGCVNMSMKDAEEFYNMVLYGDPVEVTNTGVDMTPADWIYDWIYTPEEWKNFSAL
jgi:lipoprotein-anchoring transpeptidase ErfK/SrfK